DFLKGNKVSLGLDLQGGTHLVLAVDIDQAVVNSLEVNADQLRRGLRKNGGKGARVEHPDPTTLTATVPSAQRVKLVEIVGQTSPNLKLDNEETTGDGTLVQRIVMLPEEVKRIKQAAVDQSLETIRNRIDQFGVSEPIIQRQGDRDILIQLPGI